MMEDHSTIGRRSKRKGKKYEARVAQLLTEFTKIPFRRVPCSSGFNKSGGVILAVQVFTGDVFCEEPNFIFSVEAKNRKDISLTALLKDPQTASFTEYWYQCVEDAISSNRKPIMFFKPNHADDWVAIAPDMLTYLGLDKAIKIVLDVYPPIIALKVVNRDNRGKKLSVEVKEVHLPAPIILDWKEFTKHVEPNKLFNKDLIKSGV